MVQSCPIEDAKSQPLVREGSRLGLPNIASPRSADSVLVSKCALVSVLAFAAEADYLNPEEVTQSLVEVVPSRCAGIHQV